MPDAPVVEARPAPPAEAPIPALVTAAAGEPARYPEVDRALLEGKGGGGLPMCFDLTTTKEWDRLDPDLRAEVARTASAYLATFRAQDPPRWPVGLPEDLARVAVRALVLLARPENVARFPPADVLDRIGSLLLADPLHEQDLAARGQALSAVWAREPAVIRRTLREQLPAEHPEAARRIFSLLPAECWDDELRALLLDLARGPLKPWTLTTVLAELVARGDVPAKQLAEEMVDGRDAMRAAAVAFALASVSPVDEGRRLVALVTGGGDVAEAVVRQAVEIQDRTMNLVRALPADAVSDLYIGLVNGPAPLREDPAKPFRDSREIFRDHLLSEVVHRGEYREASRIADAMNEQPTALRLSVHSARKNALRRAWSPPQPGEVVRLTEGRHHRLVRDADDLLDVVLEALEAVQRDLQGETPLAYLLWDGVLRRAPANGQVNPSPRPKDEESLSDFLLWQLNAHLRRSGIVLNREVQIRRGGDGWAGQKIDIRIDASTAVGEAVSVIVEVKGSWNDEWDTAMETQLVQRYLKNNQVRHGIYLIGWFPDGRKAANLACADVESQLASQAAGLSVGRIRIAAVVLDMSLY